LIKTIPEDFVVEEKADLPLRQRGDHRLYLLQKSHWNTLDLIHYLSRVLNLPADKFSYGGKKDRHGLTSQFVTIRDMRDFSRRGKDFSLESRGFMDRPMGPDLIQGNAFTVTIRDCDDTASVETAGEDVKQTGFPNFFDDQRFRSYDPQRGFFAEKVLKRHWNGALQVQLTSSGSDAPTKDRERKDAFFKNWKDWPVCLSLAEDPFEKKIFGFLKGHPKDFARALHMIPQEEVSMLYAAFQSHLWNEVLRRLIRLKVGNYEEIKGAEGSYFFWRQLDDQAFDYLKALDIPTAAAKMGFGDDLTRTIYQKILEEKGLKPGSFRTKALRRTYFRSFERKAMIIPDVLQILDQGEDDFHPGKKKVTMTFFLPRGSYGTMLIKRLTGLSG
jgi:tRNA pseudouridine13 synthase